MATTNITPAFVTAGKALFTVSNGAGDWYTFNVENATDVSWFAGTDNMKPSSYAPLGTIDQNLQLTIAQPKCPKCNSDMKLRQRRSDNQLFFGCCNFPNCYGTQNYDARTETAIKAFQFAMLVVKGLIPATMYVKAEVKHANKCCKCRRTLTTPESIEKGIGPECSGEKRATPKRKKQVV